ncbi:MAG: hypothetical protein ACXQTI_07485 [Candidatus Nezhaarchaeales archaeon]
MPHSHSIHVPICILGQAIVQYNQPTLCYVSHENELLITVNPGVGTLKVEGLEPFSSYIERKLRNIVKKLELDINIKSVKPLPLLDLLIAILYVALKERGTRDTVNEISRRLKLRRERVRLTLKALKAEGVLAYRENEGLLELQEEFPWVMGLCFKAPFKFGFLEEEELEESFNVALHALGRLVILAARSIVDGDFKLFKKVLMRYSRLSIALSNLPLSILKAYDEVAKLEDIACKIDEDFRGFMLFCEDKDRLAEGLNIVQKMGFKAITLRC